MSDNRNEVNPRPLDALLADLPEHELSRQELLVRASLAGGAALATLVVGGEGIAQGARHSAATLKPRRGGRLRVATIGSGDKERLDPHFPESEIDYARVMNLFETLTFVGLDKRTMFRLAESMEPNAQATRWQVKLRSGVTFHNAKPLTADDVLFTLQRILNPKTPFIGRTLLEPIDLKRTRRIDSKTISIALKRPVGNLPDLFHNRALGIIPEGTKNFSPPIGTGPFKFVSWERGRRSLFRRYDGYWDGEKPYLDELELLSINEAQARINALLAGQVDAVAHLDFPQAKALASNRKFRVYRVPGGTSGQYYMRLDRAPFDDNRVRVALKLAIDRPKAVKVAWLGFGAVANDVIGLGWPSYADKLPRRKYDPEKAKFLLKQAGHDDLEVTLVTGPILPGVVEASQVYAESAKRAGINIKLLQVSADEFWNTKLYYLKIPFGATWWPAVSFEEWASAQLISSARFNETVWKRPDWDARFRKAQALSDDNKRNTIYADLQREFWDEGGYIVYGLADFTGAAAAKVKGIVPRPGRPLGNNQFQNVWIG